MQKTQFILKVRQTRVKSNIAVQTQANKSIMEPAKHKVQRNRKTYKIHWKEAGTNTHNAQRQTGKDRGEHTLDFI